MNRSLSIVSAITVAASMALPGTASASVGMRSYAAPALSSIATALTSTKALPIAVDRGVVASTMPMHIAVAMRGDAAGVAVLVKHMYTKGDPLYHKFLTPAEFTARFSPSVAQADAVASYLAASGMRNVKITPNRLLVTADSTSGVVSKTFATSIHATLQLGHAAFANVLPARVPAALASSVQSVLGLDNFQMQRFIKRMPTADLKKFFGNKVAAMKPFSTTKGASSVAPGCNDYVGIVEGELGASLPLSNPTNPLPFCYPAQYTPTQYRIAYDDYGQPAASTTAIADFTEGATNLPYGQGSLKDVVSDVYQMEVTNGIKQSPIYIKQVGPTSTDTSGATEWDIDSESAVGIAGGVKAYYFYNGTDLSTESMNEMFSQFATDDVAQLGNASFGECEDLEYLEGGLASTDLIMAESVAQGQSITVSSGDSAAEGCPGIANGTPAGVPSVEYPSSSPYAVSVGGTSLLSSATNGQYYSELTWCGISCGGGGGISAFETQSPWQEDLESSLLSQGITVGNRLVPDLAMNADPYSGLVMYASGVEEAGWGGTSLAAPLAEGVFARLESRHGNSLGQAAAALYGPYINAGGGVTAGLLENTAFKPTLPSSLTPAVIGGFNDVFLGTNTVYEATPGFDLNTGMGSFNINSLFVWWGS